MQRRVRASESRWVQVSEICLERQWGSRSVQLWVQRWVHSALLSARSWASRSVQDLSLPRTLQLVITDLRHHCLTLSNLVRWAFCHIHFPRGHREVEHPWSRATLPLQRSLPSASTTCPPRPSPSCASGSTATTTTHIHPRPRRQIWPAQRQPPACMRCRSRCSRWPQHTEGRAACTHYLCRAGAGWQVTTWFADARMRNSWRGKPASPEALAVRPMIAARHVQPGECHTSGCVSAVCRCVCTVWQSASNCIWRQVNCTAWS